MRSDRNAGCAWLQVRQLRARLAASELERLATQHLTEPDEGAAVLGGGVVAAAAASLPPDVSRYLEQLVARLGDAAAGRDKLLSLVREVRAGLGVSRLQVCGALPGPRRTAGKRAQSCACGRERQTLHCCARIVGPGCVHAQLAAVKQSESQLQAKLQAAERLASATALAATARPLPATTTLMAQPPPSHASGGQATAAASRPSLPAGPVEGGRPSADAGVHQAGTGTSAASAETASARLLCAVCMRAGGGVPLSTALAQEVASLRVQLLLSSKEAAERTDRLLDLQQVRAGPPPPAFRCAGACLLPSSLALPTASTTCTEARSSLHPQGAPLTVLSCAACLFFRSWWSSASWTWPSCRRRRRPRSC